MEEFINIMEEFINKHHIVSRGFMLWASSLFTYVMIRLLDILEAGSKVEDVAEVALCASGVFLFCAKWYITVKWEGKYNVKDLDN